MSDDYIRFTTKLKGGSDVARLLNRYPEKVGRTMESLVKQEARGLAVELARNTRPFGFSEKAKKTRRAGGGRRHRPGVRPAVRRVRTPENLRPRRCGSVLVEHPEPAVLPGGNRTSVVEFRLEGSIGRSSRSEAPPPKPDDPRQRHAQKARPDRHQRQGARHLHRQDPEARRFRQGHLDQRGEGHRRTGSRLRSMGDPSQAGPRHGHREDRRQGVRHAHQQARLHRAGFHLHRNQSRAPGCGRAAPQSVVHVAARRSTSRRTVRCGKRVDAHSRARCPT